MILDLHEELFKGEYKQVLQTIDLKLQDKQLDQGLRINYCLIKCEALLNLTKYNDALNVLKDISQNFSVKADKIRGNILKMQILRKLGRIDECSEIENIIKHEINIDKNGELNDGIYSDYYYASGNLSLLKGELDKAQKKLEIALDYAEATNDKYRLSNVQNNLGVVNYDLGEFDLALDFLNHSLNIRQQIGNKTLIADTLNNIGIIYDDLGKLTKAFDYYQQSLELYKEQNIEINLAGAYNNIAEILRVQGDIEGALDYYRLSYELFKKNENQHFIGIVLHNIGRIYFDKGLLDKAHEKFRQAEAIREQIGHENFIAETYFHLLRIYLFKHDKDGINRISTKFEQLVANSDNKRIKQYKNLSNALVLKNTPSSKERVRAQILLEKLIDEEVVDHQLSALALTHLAELLIDELKLFHQPKVLKTINRIINRLYELAQDQYNLRLIIQVLILLSRLKVIEIKVEEADHLLQQAEILARENSLNYLERQVRIEIDNLHDYLKTHRNLLESSDLMERIEQMEIDEYVNKLTRNLE